VRVDTNAARPDNTAANSGKPVDIARLV